MLKEIKQFDKNGHFYGSFSIGRSNNDGLPKFEKGPLNYRKRFFSKQSAPQISPSILNEICIENIVAQTQSIPDLQRSNSHKYFRNRYLVRRPEDVRVFQK